VRLFHNNETDPRVMDAQRAMYEGVRSLGHDIRLAEVRYEPCDVAIVWGVTSTKFLSRSFYRDEIRAAAPHCIVMERGYVRRDTHYACGLGDGGGFADYKNANSPGDRWERLGVNLRPWRQDGEHWLVLGQVPWDTSVQNEGYERRVQEIVHLLENSQKRPVRLRKHPAVVGKAKPLVEDLRNCWATIALCSTAGVDSVIEGVPHIPLRRRSMVASLVQQWTLDEPPMPDRTQWAHNLAYTQWTLDEMREGLPFQHLTKELL